MRFRSLGLGVLTAVFLAGCGARTDLGIIEEEEPDSSLPEDSGEPDVTLPDTSLPDTTPPEDVVVFDSPVEDSPIEDAPIEDAPIDTGPPPECPSDCTSNHECESMCPALTHGRYCCDIPTGMCYAVPHHHCPTIIILDAGLD